MKALAAVCRAFAEPFDVTQIEVQEPKAGEVLVRIAASGVCHSDLSVFQGAVPFPLPIVLGHEGAGTVEAVGEGVTRVRPGDHVVLSWTPQCGGCRWCRKGQPELCERGLRVRRTAAMADGTPRFLLDGSPVRQLSGLGTFSELLVADETAVVPIDHDVPFDLAALIGCAVLTGVGAAVNTARIDPGDTVVVIGCGGVGLNVVQGAVLAGAERIIAIDRAPGKAETAKQFGATDILAGTDDTVAGVREITGGIGADVAFEVVGQPATGRLAVDVIRAGGQACIVGMAPMDAMLSVPMASTFVLNGKQIIGSSYGSADVMRDVPRLIGWWREDRLRLGELISERIGLADLNAAMDALDSSPHLRTVIVY